MIAFTLALYVKFHCGGWDSQRDTEDIGTPPSPWWESDQCPLLAQPRGTAAGLLQTRLCGCGTWGRAGVGVKYCCSSLLQGNVGERRQMCSQEVGQTYLAWFIPTSPSHVCGDSGQSLEHPSLTGPTPSGALTGQAPEIPTGFSWSGVPQKFMCLQSVQLLWRTNLRTDLLLPENYSSQGNRANLQHDVLVCPVNDHSSGSFGPAIPRVLSVTQRQ